MKASLTRRIALLEQHQGDTARRMHFLTATDSKDAEDQIAELCAAGVVGPRDGFLCITGRPMVN